MEEGVLMYIITGSGRCGTTYLMQLLTELGLDTGYASGKAVNPNGDFEWIIRHEEAKKEGMPNIIKNPKLCKDLLEVADRWDWDIEHVFIPLRDWNDVARNHYERDLSVGRTKPKVSFVTEDLPEQHYLNFFKMKASSWVGLLMRQLVVANIPYTFLLFPRIVTDPEYLYENLKHTLYEVGPYDRFLEAFNKVADVGKIHYGEFE